MNIRNLEYFIKVVDTNSFTKAAEELFNFSICNFTTNKSFRR